PTYAPSIILFSLLFIQCYLAHQYLHSFPTRRSSDLKCPNTLSATEKKTIVQNFQPLQHQSVFFSHIKYSKMVYNQKGEKLLEDLDRKSTRLNSSHVKISYAVFCLKKKK